MAYIIN